MDGQIAGVTGAHTIHRLNRHAEIGYWLGQDFEGKGMMTASVGVLLDYLVEEREIHRIEARCAAGNDRSRRVMERLRACAGKGSSGKGNAWRTAPVTIH